MRPRLLRNLIATEENTKMEAALAAFLSAIPSVIGAVLILIVGWIIAGWIGGLVARALRALRFDQLAAKAGVQSFLSRAQVQAHPAEVLGDTVKWYVRLVVVLLATIAYVTVFAFGIVAAADQIGVASTLINTLFIGVVAAFALAFGLAFGLGGRDQAAEIWRDWRGTATNSMRPSEVTSGSNG